MLDSPSESSLTSFLRSASPSFARPCLMSPWSALLHAELPSHRRALPDSVRLAAPRGSLELALRLVGCKALGCVGVPGLQGTVWLQGAPYRASAGHMAFARRSGARGCLGCRAHKGRMLQGICRARDVCRVLGCVGDAWVAGHLVGSRALGCARTKHCRVLAGHAAFAGCLGTWGASRLQGTWRTRANRRGGTELMDVGVPRCSPSVVQGHKEGTKLMDASEAECWGACIGGRALLIGMSGLGTRRHEEEAQWDHGEVADENSVGAVANDGFHNQQDLVGVMDEGAVPIVAEAQLHIFCSIGEVLTVVVLATVCASTTNMCMTVAGMEKNMMTTTKLLQIMMATDSNHPHIVVLPMVREDSLEVAVKGMIRIILLGSS